MKERIVTGMLRGAAMMPLRTLYALSDFLYLVVYYIVGYRKKVVRHNLQEAFPEKAAQELKKIEKEYYRYMCDMIVETVKLLHISDSKLKRRVQITNPEVVMESLDAGKSVALLLGHYGNWEWVQEISRCFPDSFFKSSIYHPLNSKLWDNIYKQIRSRWNSHIIPMKEAPRQLLDTSHQPWICGFIADARPLKTDRNNSIPFLNHMTSFIYGSEIISEKVGADFFYLEMDRMKRGHYRITFHRLEKEGSDGQTYPFTRAFWRKFEQTINKKPAYWLWSHKRWKFDKVLITQEGECRR